MEDYRVPLDNPTPDAAQFIRSMLGQGIPEKPPMVEYKVDPVLMRPIFSELLGRSWVTPEPGDREAQVAYWDNLIEFWYRMGYDSVRMELSLPFTHNLLVIEDAAPQSDGDRAWANEHEGTITTWEEFETYDWPNVEDADFFPYEYVDVHLPDGMGLMACHSGGMYEHLMRIMSYEGLCWALHDDLGLVEAITLRLGTLMEGYYEHLLQLDKLIALFPGDDMGFRTATLISPDHLRQLTLPWHRRFAEMAHERGIPYFVHSCGDIEAIMTDLIEDVRIDGKHSFQDVIRPAAEFQKRYGDRLATLGGVDVDILALGTPGEVRHRVRSLIETCAPRGRFAVGSSNSIPSYVPVENYLTMLDEALR